MNNKKTDTSKKVTYMMKEVSTCKECMLLGSIRRATVVLPMCVFLGGSPPRDQLPTAKCRRTFGHPIEIHEVKLHIFGVNLDSKQLTLDI